MRVDARSQRKAELHCHIDGLLDPAMLDELACGGEPTAIDPVALGMHHLGRSVERWLHGYGSLVGPETHPRDRWLPRILVDSVMRPRTLTRAWRRLLGFRALRVRRQLLGTIARIAALVRPGRVVRLDLERPRLR